jgi:ecotin
MKPIFLFCSLGLFLCMELAAAHPNLKPYAEADEGMQRYVIELPALEDETLRKVELVVGQTVLTDGVNRHFFGGRVTRETIKGWGYSYYELKAIGPMAGTLMAGPPGAPMVDTFVSVRHDLGLLRYNSKLPLVVYVPEGVEVSYRLWSTEPEPIAADVQ